DLTARVLAVAACLVAAVVSAGCNQIFGITPTHLSDRHAYGCNCTCTGGAQPFTVKNDVCLPEALNPALNPALPSGFVPAATDLQNDCHKRVEQNLEGMARQCVANRIRCTCEAQGELIFDVGSCDTHCFGQDLAADCSNFDPTTGDVSATNLP